MGFGRVKISIDFVREALLPPGTVILGARTYDRYGDKDVAGFELTVQHDALPKLPSGGLPHEANIVLTKDAQGIHASFPNQVKNTEVN